MTAEAGSAYAGLERFAARKKVLADLREQGLRRDDKPHTSAVGRCQRCDTVLEPLVSLQWFVKIKPLADKAVAATEAREVTFTPELWKKTYDEWMKNIRDWCVSRQLWWGHEIPAWYCPDGHVTVPKPGDEADPAACASCGSASADARPRRLRHLVLVVAHAALGPRLAREDEGPRPLLPDRRHGHRVRHPLLLGRPDDHGRGLVRRARPLPRGLPPRPRPRRAGPEDVEDEGERHRPARDVRRVRGRRRPLRPRRPLGHRPRPPVRDDARRGLPRLRDEGLERRPLRDRDARRGARRRRARLRLARPRRPVDPRPPRRRQRRR